MSSSRTATALLATAAALALTLTGCGSSDSDGSGGEQSSSQSESESGEKSQAEVKTADEITAAMGLPEAKTIAITESNDPNKLLGRPNGYTSKVQVSVPGRTCKTAEDECGVGVEVFEDAAGAKARAKYIQGILQAAPALGTEYDTPKGTALLRINGDLTPTKAKKYAADFADALG